jgi:hypothetical protein
MRNKIKSLAAVVGGIFAGMSMYSLIAFIVTGQEANQELAIVIDGGIGAIAAIFLTKKIGWH